MTKTALETDILVEDAERYQLSRPLPRLTIPTTCDGAELIAWRR